jgi:hypothetical protein
MSGPEFRMSFSDLGALEREIAANIRYGRVFLSVVVDAPVLSEGVLVIVHPVHGGELRLPAQIVMINPDGPMRGTGIALRAFGATDVSQVESFARELEPPAAHVHPAGDELGDGVEVGPAVQAEAESGDHVHDHVHDHEQQHEHEHEQQHGQEQGRGHEQGDEGDETPIPEGTPTIVPGDSTEEPLAPDTAPDDASASAREPELEAEPTGAHDLSQDAAVDEGSDGFDEDAALGFDEDPECDAEAAAPGTQASTRQERLRSLNAVEQLKVARKGELADRIVVERLYGKQVWEALLQNPRITLPEIARIARKGSVPRPLLEVIWDNGGWTRDASVRRALLGNPKLTSDAIIKLLKQTPKHELKVLEKATAYSVAVRDAARKLLRE